MEITVPDQMFEALDRQIDACIHNGRYDDDLQQAYAIKCWNSKIRVFVMTDDITINVHGRDVIMATEVLNDIPGWMTPEDAVAIGRACINGDKDAVFETVKKITDSVIQRHAENFVKDEE